MQKSEVLEPTVNAVNHCDSGTSDSSHRLLNDLSKADLLKGTSPETCKPAPHAVVQSALEGDHTHVLVQSAPQGDLTHSLDQAVPGADQTHSLVSNFFRGVEHHAVEDTINSVQQILNHSPLDTHLPEVKFIDAPDEDSLAGTAGGIVGDVVKSLAIAAAIGYTAMCSSPILALAATGAALTILTPESDTDGKFWTDKLKSVAIDTVTFAAMGGAAKVLASAGPLADIGGRTLMQDIGIGTLSGTAGGGVNAEVSAILNDGRIATGAELLSKTEQYALFGALAGATGHVINSVADKMARTVSNGFEYDSDGRLRSVPDNRTGSPINLSYDKDGNLAKVTMGSQFDDTGIKTYTRLIDEGGNPRWDLSTNFLTEYHYNKLPAGMTGGRSFPPNWNDYTYKQSLDYTPFSLGADGKSLIQNLPKATPSMDAGVWRFDESSIFHVDWDNNAIVSRPVKIK